MPGSLHERRCRVRPNLISILVAALTLPAWTLALGQSAVRGATSRVELNVNVRDTKGPVAGLTKDDSTILDRGKKRDIAFFSMNPSRAVRRPFSLPLVNAPGTPNVFTNRSGRHAETPIHGTGFIHRNNSIERTTAERQTNL
jgi:hypothetical protein